MMSEIHQEQVTGMTTVLAEVLESPTSKQLETYHVKLEQDEDGRFVATVPQLTGVISDGATEDEALENVYEAVEAMLESMGLKKEFMLITVE